MTDAIEETPDDARSWLPVREFGVVERIEHESVATQFYAVIVPVWPIRSRYYSRSLKTGEIGYLDIPLHRRSVLLGLVRTPLWLLAVLLGSPTFALPSRWAWLLVIALPLALIAAYVTFFAGRLTPDEKARRELLRRVVGFGTPPELVDPALASKVRDYLDDAWSETSREPWHTAITNGVANELLVALADYHGRQALLEQARANLTRRRYGAR